MTALWLLFIVVFVVILVAGLPGAWKLHKMDPLARAYYLLTIRVYRLSKQVKRLNATMNKFIRTMEGAK